MSPNDSEQYPCIYHKALRKHYTVQKQYKVNYDKPVAKLPASFTDESIHTTDYGWIYQTNASDNDETNNKKKIIRVLREFIFNSLGEVLLFSEISLHVVNFIVICVSLL